MVGVLVVLVVTREEKMVSVSISMAVLRGRVFISMAVRFRLFPLSDFGTSLAKVGTWEKSVDGSTF